MSDSPRWHLDGLPGTTGIVEVMLYDDHVAAVAAAEQRVREDASCKCKFWAGHAAGVRDARDAVEALSYDDLSRDQGPNKTKRQALAAIDGLTNGKKEA